MYIFFTALYRSTEDQILFLWIDQFTIMLTSEVVLKIQTNVFFVKLVRCQKNKNVGQYNLEHFKRYMYILKRIFKVNLKRTHKSPIFIILHFANMSTFTSSILGFVLLCLLVDLYVICNSLWPCRTTFLQVGRRKKTRFLFFLGTEVWLNLHYHKKESYTACLVRRHCSQCSKHHTHWILMFSSQYCLMWSCRKKKTTKFWQRKKSPVLTWEENLTFPV